MEEKTKIYTSGKRKQAIAKAVLVSGNGKILFNKKDYRNLGVFEKLKLEEPLRLAKEVLGELKFDAFINVRGGGEKGQIEAGRLALAKAIIKFSDSEKLKEVYLKYDRNLLIADVRRKEPNKPGDSKARAKRQTSYR
jgi:small subunit ribosomal protein S9